MIHLVMLAFFGAEILVAGLTGVRPRPVSNPPRLGRQTSQPDRWQREETATCSDKAIFADFQKRAELPTGETVSVELLPNEPGEFTFARPMGMFRGRLIIDRARIQRGRTFITSLLAAPHGAT
jgi:hypothetical protein